MKPMKLIFSHSGISAYEECKRKYYYRYILGFDGARIFNPAFGFGTFTHNIMQDISEVEEIENIQEFTKSVIFQKIVEIDDDPKLDYEDRLLKLINPIANIFSKYDVYKAERWIELKLFDEKEITKEELNAIIISLQNRGKEGIFDKIVFGGFVDAEATDQKDKNGAIDWKTGRYNRKWSARYIQQIQLYVYVLRKLGFIIHFGKIIYVEQNGYEFEVDVNQKTCESVFNNFRNSCREIISKKNNIHEFPVIEYDPMVCNGCNYDLICNTK